MIFTKEIDVISLELKKSNAMGVTFMLLSFNPYVSKGRKRNTYRVVGGEVEGHNPLGRHGCK
jgi:hypothetical protein